MPNLPATRPPGGLPGILAKALSALAGKFSTVVFFAGKKEPEDQGQVELPPRRGPRTISRGLRFRRPEVDDILRHD